MIPGEATTALAGTAAESAISDVEYIAGDILVMKKGQLLHQGRPHEIIHTIDGKVWECRVPNEKAGALIESCNVGNLRAEGEETMLRIISDEKPMETAQAVDPNLEDLYLYYFADEV